MTNFATRWKAPKPKPPPRRYLNSAGSPLVSCGYVGPGSWLLIFADDSSRLTAIRPTPEMAAIHNATQAKAARARSAEKALPIEFQTA